MSDTPTAVPLEGATPAEQAQNLYDALKPGATDLAREFVLRQTPADLQEEMMTIIEADWPQPETPPIVFTSMPPKGIIGQIAAQRAEQEHAESKFDEVKAEIEASLPQPAPAPAPAE